MTATRARRFLNLLVCGLPAHRRERRLMAVYAGYGDDSGSHAQSPIMVLAVVVAEYETWKTFSDEWWQALTQNKPLRRVNNEIYFKSSDAEALTGCFESFTREEADAKVEVLTNIVLKHITYAMLSSVKWEYFTDIFQKGVPKPKGRLHNYFKHPYYLLFHDVTSSVCNMQLHEGLGEIDFVFDKQGKMLSRCIRQYDDIKGEFSPAIRQVAGQVIEGDDKVVLPIQAADLVAWQSRSRSWPFTGRDTPSVKKLAASGKVYFTVINRGFLRYFAQFLNWTPATQAMITKFAGYPTPWPALRQATGGNTREETHGGYWPAPALVKRAQRLK